MLLLSSFLCLFLLILQAVDEETATLMAKVKEHPVFESLCDALDFFGYEWKDIDIDTTADDAK